MEEQKRFIKVASLPQPAAGPFDPLKYLARLCYFYPQYTLSQARRLPYKRVRLLLGEAERQEARKFRYLTQIISAPHSKEAENNISQLIEHFGNIMDGK